MNKGITYFFETKEGYRALLPQCTDNISKGKGITAAIGQCKVCKPEEIVHVMIDVWTCDTEKMYDNYIYDKWLSAKEQLAFLTKLQMGVAI